MKQERSFFANVSSDTTRGKIERRHLTVRNRVLLAHYFVAPTASARSARSSDTATPAGTARASGT